MLQLTWPTSSFTLNAANDEGSVLMKNGAALNQLQKFLSEFFMQIILVIIVLTGRNHNFGSTLIFKCNLHDIDMQTIGNANK